LVRFNHAIDGTPEQSKGKGESQSMGSIGRIQKSRS
jgi:hypothetical protein